MAIDSDSDGVSDNLDECPNTALGEAVNLQGCVAQATIDSPETAAPTPTVDAANVLSLFSDVYYDIDNIDYNPNWGQSTVVTTETLFYNTKLKLSALNYQGISFEGNPQDVTNMDSFHLDYWTNNANDFKIFLFSPGPVEQSYPVTVKQNSWQSIDIPLSAFSGVNLNNLFQLKFEGNGTLFIDNLYFYSENVDTDVDSDADGVPDASDQCPNNQTQNVDEHGCEIASEINIAPSIQLFISQNGSNISEVSATAGLVTIRVEVMNENSSDSHQFTWTSSNQISGTINQSQFQFEPANLSGEYQI